MNNYLFDNEINKRNNMKPITFPQMSSDSKPIKNNHDHYIFDRNAEIYYNQNQGNYLNPVSTRIDSRMDSRCNNKINPVQNNFQNQYTQNFYMSNFETINNQQEINTFLDRNPVNTRRDEVEKSRNKDRNDFLRMQGGNLNNFTSFQYENTRKKKNDIDISGYIPNGRTMAIPKENI